jgi:hypothetical protein
MVLRGSGLVGDVVVAPNKVEYYHKTSMKVGFDRG